MTALCFDAGRQLAGLARSNARLEAFLARSPEQLATRLPERSAWSLQEHAFHVVLANDLSLRNASALLARRGRLIRPCEPLAGEARDVLVRGRIPRGRAQAPRFVTPPPTIDLALVREIFESTRTSCAALLERCDELADAPDCIPHQLLGGLSATAWLRFARLHSVHHLAIMRELALELAHG